MTENELRAKVVSTAVGLIGLKEADGSHKKILDIYNKHTPLARGYKVQPYDEWCATTVSTVHILCGTTDISPTECSCSAMIRLYQKLGSWIEDDTYVPKPGDTLFYAWSDTGVGDCIKTPNHVGIVVSVTGNTIKVLEGNKGEAVAYRNVAVNSRYIRGYGVPDYAGKAAKMQPAQNITQDANNGEDEDDMKIYRYVKDMPSWAQDAATKAINNGYMKMDPGGAVSVYEANLQALVWMDRAGMLDKPAKNV